MLSEVSWCNGSTKDFESFNRGSIPRGTNFLFLVIKNFVDIIPTFDPVVVSSHLPRRLQQTSDG